MQHQRYSKRACAVVAVAATLAPLCSVGAFTAPVQQPRTTTRKSATARNLFGFGGETSSNSDGKTQQVHQLASAAATGLLIASLSLGSPAFAENELSDKYGGGLDTSLVDQTCLVDQCSVQAKSCLADDPDCRKGLTCTAKCLGDNACITGCMARYGNENLDNLLKCTIEDHECIKVAILPGGADEYGQEPKAPGPTVRNFDYKSLEGSWYKVVGYNPNYDCYACQRNTFSSPMGNSNKEGKKGLLYVGNNNQQAQANTLNMDVEFSMPHLMPDGTPPPPSGVRETIFVSNDAAAGTNSLAGSQSIGLNAYNTHETMVFDTPASAQKAATKSFVMRNAASGADNNEQQPQEVSYARTAHSEGEMFGLKFWENWYVIGENDADEPEFKFVYYNGKTRQNTYEGAFIYSRTEELSPASMKKVYQIAKDAGMNPDQFCRIRNRGCFSEPDSVRPPAADVMPGGGSNLRGLLASTRVSELLGVEPVAAQDTVRRGAPTARVLNPTKAEPAKRAWWFEVGDYLENPHRHFEAMDNLRQPMEWPEDVVAVSNKN